MRIAVNAALDEPQKILFALFHSPTDGALCFFERQPMRQESSQRKWKSFEHAEIVERFTHGVQSTVSSYHTIEHERSQGKNDKNLTCARFAPSASSAILVSQIRAERCLINGMPIRQRLRVTVTSERLHAGESTAQPATDEFKTVFLQNYTRIYNVLFRLVGNRADAEDLTLETFLKLWQQPRFRADNLGGWLYRVATRLGYNALRAAKRRTQYEQNAGRDAIEHAEVIDPAREAERADERAQVREVLGGMTERDAQLLILRHSGMLYKEIANTLNVSPNSVGTLLMRAEAEFERRYLA